MLFNVPGAKSSLNFIFGLSGYGDAATLDGVLELAMTTACCHEIPAIRFQLRQNFVYFHAESGADCEASVRRNSTAYCAEWQDGFANQDQKTFVARACVT